MHRAHRHTDNKKPNKQSIFKNLSIVSEEIKKENKRRKRERKERAKQEITEREKPECRVNDTKMCNKKNSESKTS